MSKISYYTNHFLIFSKYIKIVYVYEAMNIATNNIDRKCLIKNIFTVDITNINNMIASIKISDRPEIFFSKDPLGVTL